MTRDELERLRARADETGQVRSDYKSQRRAQLKKMSDDKMKHWPNTLEANRIKKLRFVEEKARKRRGSAGDRSTGGRTSSCAETGGN